MWRPPEVNVTTPETDVATAGDDLTPPEGDVAYRRPMWQLPEGNVAAPETEVAKAQVETTFGCGGRIAGEGRIDENYF